MSLFALVVLLALMGIGLGFLHRMGWVEGKIMTLIDIVVVCIALFLVANACGVMSQIQSIKVPQV